MKCPKVYLSYDVSNSNCPVCKQGMLYRQCGTTIEHPACAGWADDQDVYCCSCYKEKHKNDKTGQ